MYDHKEEIINTRKGFLGGSDAKMIQQCAELGSVPKSAMKRLAVCKGLIEPENFTNVYMEYGNYIEDAVFQSLKATDERWQSNPRLESEVFSRPNCKVIDHVDFLLQDDENKVLTIAECKAVRLTFEQTRDEYKWQLAHHWRLANEMARKLGGYKVKLLLCHYRTDDVDFSQAFEFDPSRLTVKALRGMERLSNQYNIGDGMNIIDKFLETFDAYYEGDEIPSELLPANVQEQFAAVTNLLAEIKEREAKVDEFKKKLYDFLLEKNVKSIKNDAWSITRVDATTSTTFDTTRYLNDLQQEHPRVAVRLRSKYMKTTKRNGYVTIKLNDKTK